MTFLSTVGTVFYALCIIDTYRCAVSSRRGISSGLSAKWAIVLFTMALAIFLLVFSIVVAGTMAINFIGYAVNVDSKSMDPTLKPGEKVLANRQVRFTDDLRNGDMVAVSIPGYKRREEIRRVIALPGQRVMMMCGQVILDGREIREDYVSYRQELSTYIPGHRALYFQEHAVPEDSVFLLSDVRDLGEDSREWGPVKETRILGRVDFLFYPPERHQQFADSYLSALTRKLIRLISLDRGRL
jgi:signal peptidase I